MNNGGRDVVERLLLVVVSLGLLRDESEVLVVPTRCQYIRLGFTFCGALLVKGHGKLGRVKSGQVKSSAWGTCVCRWGGREG